LIDHPQIPSKHRAYYPNKPDQVLKSAKDTLNISDGNVIEDKLAQQKDLRERASVVFGSRLTGPQRRREIEKKAKFIAGVRVPLKPEEPDNCCMSGCVNCVWDVFREELEDWAAANSKAQKALRKLEGKEDDKRPNKPNNVANGALESTSMDDDAGRAVVNLEMWEGFEDIPIGIRAFMETEKGIKLRRAARERITT